MDIEKLIEQLTQHDGIWCSVPTGENLIADASTALSTLQAENENLRAENEKLLAENIMHHNSADNYFAEAEEYRQERNETLAELEEVKHALAEMWFAYENKDGEFPHDFEEKAVSMAREIFGPWGEMVKWLKRGL